MINSRNEELTKLENDANKTSIDVANCAFKCFRYFLNDFLSDEQKIPDEDFDLSELESTILTHVIITDPEFSGIIHQ